MGIGRVLRISGAISLLVAGLVHLDLYFGGYRSAGTVPSFGRSILLNAVVSGIVAALVAARSEWFVRLAGIVVPVATLAAFTYTHTEHTFLGFQGDGLDPSPQAQIVLVAEIATIVLLGATFLPSIAARDESSGVPVLAVTSVVAAAALIGFGVYWADKYGTTTTEAQEPTSVAIADFAFSPPALTVASGSTVTWTNGDPFGHSVIGSDGAFASPSLDSGATFDFTFDTPGEYAYVCGIHPEMTGTVTVTD
jgi:plastocyanin